MDRAYVDKGFNGQSWFRLREQFLKTVPMTERSETYTAIRKMLATLDDPFTRFLEPARYAQLKRGAQGSVTGVGLEVAFSQEAARLGQLLVRLGSCAFRALVPGGPPKTLKTHGVQVVAPAPQSPADKAGIKAQDAVLAVDGQKTQGKSLYDVADLLQGEPGSSVVLSVLAKGDSRAKDVTLLRYAPPLRCLHFHIYRPPLSRAHGCRERVQVVAVRSQTCSSVSPTVGAAANRPVGVLRVATFNKQTVDLFTQQLRALNKAGVGAIILDLRNNGGGSFPAGVQVRCPVL